MLNSKEIDGKDEGMVRKKWINNQVTLRQHSQRDSRVVVQNMFSGPGLPVF